MPRRLRSLLLNGSPHADGNSMTLAGALCDALGGDVRTVHLHNEGIAPCRACGACSGGAGCVVADAMRELLDTLSRADAVIVASPLHFTSLAAPVIGFYSRLQPFWARRRRIGPSRSVLRTAGALVVTAGSNYPGMFGPARSVTAAVFNTIGVHFSGMATAAGTDGRPVRENAQALAEARKLGEDMRAFLAARSA